MTYCNSDELVFQPLGRREVCARFEGTTVTSDAGGLLLREIEEKFHFIDQFSGCFTDHRDSESIEHTLAELLRQRIFGLCLGYEDLDDHDQLRHDPLLAVLVGKEDPTGQNRHKARDRGIALAGKSTLNRLELTPVRASARSRYKKIVAHLDAMQSFLLEAFLQQHVVAPEQIVLDLDTTDFVLQGHQLGRFFHGYYDEYCYLPLYVFCGDPPLLALLRPSNLGDTVGAQKHLKRIITRIRQVWPDTQMVLRGDSGFAREHLMRFCEEHQVDYVFGLAQNSRLKEQITPQRQQAQQLWEQTGSAVRLFADFLYQTRTSWSRERRVVAKAEHLPRGANPRFVVTSLSSTDYPAQPLYEELYCARGDMENRIKEQQLMLFADRVSCSTLRANQVRLCLTTVAYVILRALREHGLAKTELASAQCSTIRNRLLKIGAVVKISVRRVFRSLSAGWPFRQVLLDVGDRLQHLIVPDVPLPDTG